MISEELCFVAIDIGGTWIKACCIKSNSQSVTTESIKQVKNTQTIVKSSVREDTTPSEFVNVIEKVIGKIGLGNRAINGIGLSTTGIVNYHGTRVLRTVPRLSVLGREGWKEVLEARYGCPVIITNDADAAAIGLAEMGCLKGNKTVGIMPIGTGLGFTVWRNGRRWRPAKSLTLLGSIMSMEGSFNAMASASKLASHEKDHNLLEVFVNPDFEIDRDKYIQGLAKTMQTAAILYNLDEILICGGLANASYEAKFPLAKRLNDLLEDTPPELGKQVVVKLIEVGNLLQLVGASMLAMGECLALQKKVSFNYGGLETEMPFDETLRLEQMSSVEIVQKLWKAEEQAGSDLGGSLAIMASLAEKAVEKIKAGGRIIYIGSGTSGRLAAMDAVEIPCTYGFPEDRIITLVSGGIADAAIEIESDFEEDASSIPEMLLLNITANDVVIGISASGTAYYVQSALIFSKNRGALTVQIQVNRPKMDLAFCDYVVPLCSGNEVVAGSTRMKAGTSTKKVLNFFSTTVMIKLGKVVGSYMVDVACINNKLVERAQHILQVLYDIDKKTAHKKLVDAEMDLHKVIKMMES